MSYAATRARAYRQVKRAGARVTFSGVTTAVNKLTGESSVTETTVLGYAITTPGALKLYEALKLVVGKTLTLLFAPDAGASMPTLGMTVVWGGVTYTVKHTQEIAPGGTLLVGRVIVSA